MAGMETVMRSEKGTRPKNKTTEFKVIVLHWPKY